MSVTRHTFGFMTPALSPSRAADFKQCPLLFRFRTIDKLEGDERSRAIGHRAGEWMFERHHSMFLRERMGTDLEYHP